MKIIDNAPRARTPQAVALAAKRFSSFKGESEKEMRRPVVRETIEKKILEAWHEARSDDCRNGPKNHQETISRALFGVCASQADIDTFISHLQAHHETKGHEIDFVAGLFLSELVNEGSEDEYTLNLSGLPRITGLGDGNCKRLTIIGSVGECAHGNSSDVKIFGDASVAGYGQDSGSIEIFGNCDVVGSYMSGGRITIHGTSEMLGREMTGGRIDVLGKVKSTARSIKIGGSWKRLRGNLIGDEMSGGEIHIHSGHISPACLASKGGRIYIKERLVFEEGKWVRWRFKAEQWLQSIFEGRK